MAKRNKERGIRDFFKRLARGSLQATGAVGTIAASQPGLSSTPQGAALFAGASAVAMLTPLLDQIIFGTLDDRNARNEKVKLDNALDDLKSKLDQHDTDLAELLVAACIQYDMSQTVLTEIKNVAALLKDPDTAPIPQSLQTSTVEAIIAKANADQTAELESHMDQALDRHARTIIEEQKKTLAEFAKPGSPPQKPPRIHNLPYTSIGHLFKGRQVIFDNLKTDLDTSKSTAIIEALHGLGGIGKTRLAIEFAWWAFQNNKYSPVFYVKADSPQSLHASLAALAAEDILNLTDKDAPEEVAYSAVIRWLGEKQNWLMILDGTDTEPAAKAVEDLLPSLAQGRAVITSRYTRWGPSVTLRRLDILKPDDAKQFLLDRTAGRRIETPQDDSLARQIADELGYLPLLLEQAGAYISHGPCPLADYLADWQSDRKDVLKWFNKRLMNYPDSAAITYQRTIRQLSDTSRTILNIASFLSPEPDAIPIKMFQKGKDLLADSRSLLNPKSRSSLSESDVTNAVSDIVSYSMAAPHQAGFSIHRLVLEVICSQIPQKSRRKWLEKSIRIVNNYAPTESYDVRTWPVWDVLRPHAEKIAEAADHAKITNPTCKLMTILGNYHMAKGLYNTAETLLRRSIPMVEESFAPHHPNLAIALANLAQLLRATNRLAKAEPLMRRALNISDRSFGPYHPAVARDLNNLAELLQATNRLGDAEPLLRRAVEIYEKSLGKDDPNVATSLNNLAALLQATNRLAEAEPLMRRVIEIWEKSLGKNHPKVATALNNLALLLKATNRLAEAEPLMRRALAIDEKSFGPDHPEVATDLNNLAVLLHDTNRLAEAEPLLCRALQIDEKSFGPDHPNVAIRLNNLVGLLQDTNRLAEAEPLMRRALKIFETSLGADHPKTKTARTNLLILENQIHK